MARIFNSNKTRSFFSKKKETYTDTCCDTSTSCCDTGLNLLKYKIFYLNTDAPPASEITTPTAAYNLKIGEKWNLYLEVALTDPSVDITSIIVTPISPNPIPEINVFSPLPVTVLPGSSNNIIGGNFSITGIRVFNVTVNTSAGNTSLQITLTVS